MEQLENEIVSQKVLISNLQDELRGSEQLLEAYKRWYEQDCKLMNKLMEQLVEYDQQVEELKEVINELRILR